MIVTRKRDRWGAIGERSQAGLGVDARRREETRGERKMSKAQVLKYFIAEA